MYGLSQAEIEGSPTNPIDLAFADPDRLARLGILDPNRNDYLDRAVAGGFPSAFALDERARTLWLRSYATELLERDAVTIARLREPAKLRATLLAHLDLLENLQLLVRLPAWTPNRLRRLIHAPKLHLTDSAVAASVLGVNARALRLDASAGALLETFVVGELLRHAPTALVPIDLFHMRSQDGNAVDVVAVAADGRVVGFEVNAAARPAGSASRGLRWLRDKLGDAFTAGYVLHTGPLSQRLDDRLWATPIAALWRAQPS